jgi:GNAT superfamily N-acetyltransferase
MIRRPTPREIKLLPQIENAADRRYARVGLERVLDMPPASLHVVKGIRSDSRVWLAVSPLGRPVGFALLVLWRDVALLDQLSVLPDWQRRGFGAGLIDRAADAARRSGHRAIYLSTYRDVPWNAPYYARRGFRPVPRGSQSRSLRQLLLTEIRMGHPPWRRTIMQRAL